MNKIAFVFAIALMAGCTNTAEEMPTAAGHDTARFDATAPMQASNSSMVNPSGAADIAFAAQPARLDSNENRADTNWGSIYTKAGIPGVRYNLNQPAKAVDAGADNWSLVFAFHAPFQDGDALYYCGPLNTFTVQVYAYDADILLYDGVITGVPPCN